MKVKSWQTTAGGLAGFMVLVLQAAVALLDGDPDTQPDFTAILAMAPIAFALLKARDNNKSSSSVGAK